MVEKAARSTIRGIASDKLKKNPRLDLVNLLTFLSVDWVSALNNLLLDIPTVKIVHYFKSNWQEIFSLSLSINTSLAWLDSVGSIACVCMCVCMYVY